MQLAAPLLLVAAGLALILQNLLMSATTERASSVLIPLVMNSTVGLGLLGGLLLWQGGVGTLREMVTMARPLHAVPGLLGSFFVFASLTGYRHIGAAPTIAILVSSQLMFGLGADLLRGGDLQPLPILGVMLLIIGSCLVVFGKV